MIDIQKLHKKFGFSVALNGLNLKVAQGEIHGFLGPNGSGKTTTIRILLGLLRKDGGEVSLMGQDPWQDAVSLHKKLAYVPGDVNLWDNFTGDEAIHFMAKMRGSFDADLKKKLVKRFDLDTSKRCRAYSKGNRQKVALISTFVSDVDLYILDEPTSGLDPLMEELFQETIREMAAQGKTFLLSSHILSEVEALCDKITIIRKGETIESGALKEMRHLKQQHISLTARQDLSALAQFEGLNELNIVENRASFSIESSRLNALLQFAAQFEVLQLESRQPSLEELFLHVYHNP